MTLGILEQVVKLPLRGVKFIGNTSAIHRQPRICWGPVHRQRGFSLSPKSPGVRKIGHGRGCRIGRFLENGELGAGSFPIPSPISWGPKGGLQWTRGGANFILTRGAKSTPWPELNSRGRACRAAIPGAIRVQSQNWDARLSRKVCWKALGVSSGHRISGNQGRISRNRASRSV